MSKPTVPIMKAIGFACLGVGLFFIVGGRIFFTGDATLAQQSFLVGASTLVCGAVILIVRAFTGPWTPKTSDGDRDDPS